MNSYRELGCFKPYLVPYVPCWNIHSTLSVHFCKLFSTVAIKSDDINQKLNKLTIDVSLLHWFLFAEVSLVLL